MQKRHGNRRQYFDEQGITTEKFVIPYLKDIMPISKDTRILEIGCGEGGNMVPFLKMGCECVGVDLNGPQLEKAKEFFEEIVPENPAELHFSNIYDMSADDIGTFDLIIMRDVIEHIHDQETFMAYLKQFLSPEGKIFFGFPPWYMPFGGHQQICHSKFLSKLPWFHLLPAFLYRAILKAFGETEKIVSDLLEIKETGISMERFYRIVKKENYTIVKNTPYLFNPNYEIKFNLKPREQFPVLKSIPFFRNFYTTCLYCVIE